MWDRAQLKDKAKATLKQNYWKLVLVSLLAGTITGTSGSLDFNFDTEGMNTSFFTGLAGLEALWASIALGFALFCLVIMAVAILMDIFVLNPLQVGTSRFFIKSYREEPEFKELMYAYDRGYRNVVKILFKKNLKIFLWSLLLFVPGIIKAYEYMMVPYLLAEDPNLPEEEVFALSKAMMHGNKFDAFVLELSFIGWDILSGFTLGVLSIFFVQPYKYLTKAALFETLSVAYRRPVDEEPHMGYEEI